MSNLMDIMPLAARGYCCSQIIVQLALQAQGLENPGLVRAAGGLCWGMGGTGGCCGILTGACLVLGLYAGKGADQEQAYERFDLLVSEFVEWFQERAMNQFGGIECRLILKEGKPDASRCGGLVSDSWDRILELLVEHGIDPSEPRE